MLDHKRLKRFLSKDYRDEYLQGTVKAGIAYQIHAIRTKFGMSQAAFAAKVGKPQSVISRLENEEYGKVTVQTLLDVACANDIALIVRFTDYPRFFSFANAMSERDLQPDTVTETFEHIEAGRIQVGQSSAPTHNRFYVEPRGGMIGQGGRLAPQTGNSALESTI